jgi:capsular polysaccharide biosynthesis protein
MVLPHSPYYYHILIDEIPNLIRIRDEYPACNSVIVNKSMPKWGLELLNYFGFSAILTSENTLRLERLLTVSAPRSIVKENLLLLRRKLLQTENKIVIVSRSGSPREDQVIENALKKYIPDSELVNPAELSVEEQVTLFSNAKIVIGLHGGGLSNIVWMHSAGKLIELFNHPYRTADYERLCVELGIGYFGLDAMDKTTSELISIVRGFVYAD